MIFRRSRFPLTVLAAVLSAGDLFSAPAPEVGKPEATIFVEATYPGANATTVAQTVAAPIEHQVEGVEHLLRMVSRSTGDGRYILALTFEPGTDLDAAGVLVQKRVAFVEPRLPEEVRRERLTVKKHAPVLVLINLSSPTERYDTLYLSNYAAIHIIDKLKQLKGVGDVKPFGQLSASMRVWLDPKKLAALTLAPEDVVAALKHQNLKVTSEQGAKAPKDQQLPLTIHNPGRLGEGEGPADIVVKRSAKGEVIRLKDVGSVESGFDATENCVSFNGKPSAAVGVYPDGATDPKDVSRAVADKLATLRPRLPDDLQLDVAFDFTATLEAPDKPTTPEYLLLDLQLPDAASTSRIHSVLASCDELLHTVRGVQDVLALTENPFDVLRNQPCILIRLQPAGRRKLTREEIVRRIRTELDTVPNAVVRMRDLVHPGASASYGYPIELAVRGPDAVKVRELAQKLGERLQKCEGLTDVLVNRQSAPRRQLEIDIDLVKAKALDVPLKAIFDTIQIYFGSVARSDFNKFARLGRITVAVEDPPKNIEDLGRLQIRNDKGQIVTLSSFAAIRTVEGPMTIKRIDSKPAVEVSANPAAKVSPAQGRALCEARFEELRRELKLPAAYHLVGLQEPPGSNK